ncbi:MAG TPA: heavy metal-associated domain-containing protein [Candidatus Polarisedimenticolia bacterium]|nr:heavy metal-associated domain-containing protein [Candidatus Polarisedimenticolia bacterium]
MRLRKMSACAVMLGLLLATAAPLLAGEEATADLNVKLSVRGMTCDGCAKGVKAALEKTPGVKSAEVNLEKNEAAVIYEKGKTTPEALVKAVEKAGYKCSLQKDDKAGA